MVAKTTVEISRSQSAFSVANKTCFQVVEDRTKEDENLSYRKTRVIKAITTNLSWSCSPPNVTAGKINTVQLIKCNSLEIHRKTTQRNSILRWPAVIDICRLHDDVRKMVASNCFNNFQVEINVSYTAVAREHNCDTTFISSRDLLYMLDWNVHWIRTYDWRSCGAFTRNGMKRKKNSSGNYELLCTTRWKDFCISQPLG